MEHHFLIFHSLLFRFLSQIFAKIGEFSKYQWQYKEKTNICSLEYQKFCFPFYPQKSSLIHIQTS